MSHVPLTLAVQQDLDRHGAAVESAGLKNVDEPVSLKQCCAHAGARTAPATALSAAAACTASRGHPSKRYGGRNFICGDDDLNMA